MWVDHESKPKSKFVIRVNDGDIYRLPKEEVDYDPSKTERLGVELKMNEKMVIEGSMPWITDDVDDKVEIALGPGHLSSLDISYLECESWVANEFLDLMCGYDLPEQGLEKLTFN